MSLIRTAKEFTDWLESHDRKNKTLGFVPTMGCLHDGHFSLIKAAREQNDLVAVSVFVNPMQFSPEEDYEAYPRDIERDYKLAINAGADVVFYPDTNEIYPQNFSTEVEVKGSLTKRLCGKSRPAHFKGVVTVLNILFNIVRPDHAYFGQKDAQQAIVVKKMVRDLHIPVKIVVCPIVREKDGLAMSSRNLYLNPVERQQAVSLNRALQKACKYLASGAEDCNDVNKLIYIIRCEIQKESLAKIEYIEILDNETLENIKRIEPPRKAIAAVAVKFGKARLIDNVILSLKEV